MSAAIKFYKADEMAHLISVCQQSGQADCLFIELLAVTGMRTDELCKLRRRDFDDRSCRVYVHGSKLSRDGWVELGRDLYRRLSHLLLGELSSDQFILEHICSKPETQASRQAIRRLWARVRRQAFGFGNRLSVHKLRHSVGQAVYEQTRDPFMIMAALRHKSMSSSMRYVQADNAQEAMAIVRRAFKVR